MGQAARSPTTGIYGENGMKECLAGGLVRHMLVARTSLSTRRISPTAIDVQKSNATRAGHRPKVG
jgi:hypothetical protein